MAVRATFRRARYGQSFGGPRTPVGGSFTPFGPDQATLIEQLMQRLIQAQGQPRFPAGSVGGGAAGGPQIDRSGQPTTEGAGGPDLSGILSMGGSIKGYTRDGKYVIVTVGGQDFAVDAKSGAPVGFWGPGGVQSTPAGTTTGAEGAPGATGAGAGAAAAGGGAAGAGAGAGAGGGGTSRVGRTVTGKLADGSAMSGQITEERPDGSFTVRWQNGDVSIYNAQGQHVSTTQAGAGGGGGGDGAPAPAPAPAPGPVTGGPDRGGAPVDLTTTAPAPAPAPVPSGGAGSTFIDQGAYVPPPAPAPSGTGTFIDAGVNAPVVSPPPSPTYGAPGDNMLSLDATFAQLGAMPSPEISATIPTEFAIQLPPPIDETNYAAGYGDLLTEY